VSEERESVNKQPVYRVIAFGAISSSLTCAIAAPSGDRRVESSLPPPQP
jgi:hypothetical protein